MKWKRRRDSVAALLLIAALALPASAELRVLHRAGQTFVIFDEANPIIEKEQITWG